jgi:type II secretory pathway pseudopilin PulG
MVLGSFTSHIDVVGSVTTIVGSVLVFINSQLEKKHKWFAILGFGVVFVGGVLTFVASQMASHSQATRQQQEVERQTNILQNATDINTQVSAASGKLKDLQQNLSDEKKAVSDLTGNVKSGTRQLLGATKQVSDAVTGGTNFCYLRAYPDDAYGGSPYLMRIQIINPGVLPCYDVSFIIKVPIPPSDDLATRERKSKATYYGNKTSFMGTSNISAAANQMHTRT